MKTLTIILTFLTLTASAQLDIRYFPDSMATPKRIRIPVLDDHDLLPIGLMFIAGFADGTAESLKEHYDVMSAKWHWDDDQYWDYRISWKNKWKNGDPSQGEVFFGSKTFLVWTTDGYHMTRMVRNQCIVGAIVLNIGERNVWWKVLIEGVLYYLSYTCGFNLAYEVIWK